MNIKSLISNNVNLFILVGVERNGIDKHTF